MAKIASKIEPSVTKEQKVKYKITNWSEYNKTLVNRGNITIWIDEDSIKNWYYDGPKAKGGQYEYSDQCIECLLGLKVVFGLGYRQLEGFASSIVCLMGLSINIPCYTQICRRASTIEINLNVPKSNTPLFIVVDSTGLKVYGEGEWKARKHGVSKRRTWRKLHLGVDEKTGMIYAEVLTGNGKGDGDAQQVKDMLEQVESPIDRFSGDGAYDTFEIWDYLNEKKIQGIIPPQENAVYWYDENGELLDLDRNEILKQIHRDGREEWKQKSGYHRRSLSETAMFRFKTIFGAELYSRDFAKQKTEARIKTKCLNKMTAIGMPISEKTAA